MPDEDARITDFIPDDGEATPADDGSGGPVADGDEEDSVPDEATTGEAGGEATSERPGVDGLDDATPAVSTADWTPGGGDCEACGAAVERRWRDDGALVCGDCKEW